MSGIHYSYEIKRHWPDGTSLLMGRAQSAVEAERLSAKLFNQHGEGVYLAHYVGPRNPAPEGYPEVQVLCGNYLAHGAGVYHEGADAVRVCHRRTEHVTRGRHSAEALVESDYQDWAKAEVEG